MTENRKVFKGGVCLTSSPVSIGQTKQVSLLCVVTSVKFRSQAYSFMLPFDSVGVNSRVRICGDKVTSRVLTFGKDKIVYLPVYSFGYLPGTDAN